MPRQMLPSFPALLMMRATRYESVQAVLQLWAEFFPSSLCGFASPTLSPGFMDSCRVAGLPEEALTSR